MSRAYATGTKVDEMSTRHQIETLLFKHGASDVATHTSADKTSLGFIFDGLMYRVDLPMAIDVKSAQQTAYDAAKRAGGGRRHFDEPDVIRQERSRRMRALLTVIKAKIIAVEEGITSFEVEFLSHVVTGNGQTVHERMVPELKQASIEGRVPNTMPQLGGRS